MKKVVLICSLLLAGIITAGCLPIIAAGGAGVREMTDKAIVYKGNIASLDNAVRKAIKNLGGVIKEVVSEEGKKGKRTFRGKTYDDEVLTIDLEPTSPNSVNVEIRVGRIGNKNRAHEYHKAIQKYAKTITE
ncbi:MAG: DUF3568 family protein [Planctomycetota bacterium]